MGEIADAMLGGELCEACGSFLGEPEGYPRYCSVQCAKDRGVTDPKALAILVVGEYEWDDDDEESADV